MGTSTFWKRVVAVAAVFTLGIGGGVAVASHQFGDVPDSNIFHDEIDFLASRSITLGCGGGNYCPKSAVNREQMAAFLERTARALSPVHLWADQVDTLAQSTPACIVGPFTPDYEMLAVLEGGLDAEGAATGHNRMNGRTQVRVNGGSWTNTANTWNLLDNAGPDTWASTPIGGRQPLLPGTTYEFAITPNQLPATTSNSCYLSATLHHQMPDAIAPFGAFAAPNSTERELPGD